MLVAILKKSTITWKVSPLEKMQLARWGLYQSPPLGGGVGVPPDGGIARGTQADAAD